MNPAETEALIKLAILLARKLGLSIKEYDIAEVEQIDADNNDNSFPKQYVVTIYKNNVAIDILLSIYKDRADVESYSVKILCGYCVGGGW